MEWLNNLLISLSDYPIIISFLAGLISGETVIISLAFLSGNGLFPLWIVFVFTFLGVVITDIAIFFVGRLKFVHNFHKLWKFSKAYQKADRFISRLSKENIFLVILYSKFMYGARILTLVYLGLKKAKIRTVLVSLLIIHFFTILIIVSIGWLAGKGFSYVASIYKDIKIAIIVLILLIIFYYFLKKLITYYVSMVKKGRVKQGYLT